MAGNGPNPNRMDMNKMDFLFHSFFTQKHNKNICTIFAQNISIFHSILQIWQLISYRHNSGNWLSIHLLVGDGAGYYIEWPFSTKSSKNCHLSIYAVRMIDQPESYSLSLKQCLLLLIAIILYVLNLYEGFLYHLLAFEDSELKDIVWFKKTPKQ